MRYIEMACPQCDRGLRVRSEYLGRPVICNHCDHGFQAVASSSGDSDETPCHPYAERVAALEGALQDALAERRAIELERATLAGSLREARDDCARLRDEAGQLRARLETAEALAGEANEIARAEQGRLEAEVRANRDERDRLAAEVRANRDERDQVAADRDALASELDRARDDLRAVRSQLETAEALAGEANEIARAEQGRLEAEVRANRDERDRLAAEVRANRDERDQVAADRDALASELDRARDDLRAVRSQLETASGQWEAARSELARSLDEERTRQAAALADQQATHARLREQTEALTRELDRVAADRTEAEERSARLERDLAERASEVRQIADERTRLIDDLDRAHTLARYQAEENAALRERAQHLAIALENRVRDEEAQRLERERLADDLRRQVDDLRTDRDSALERCSTLERTCADLGHSSAALAEVSRDRNEAVRLARDLARQVAELQSELDRRDRAEACCSDNSAPPKRDQLPALGHDDGGSWDGGYAFPPVVDAPPAPAPRMVQVGAAVPSNATVQSEVDWYVEMNRRINELNRRRRR